MRPDDPASLSPEKRFREIARLLAQGVSCLLSGRAAPVSPQHPAPEKHPKKLPELP
jgi:hypothetical protein